MMTTCVCVCAEEKLDTAIDDWEAIATDEEKGESECWSLLFSGSKIRSRHHIKISISDFGCKIFPGIF